MCYVFFFQAEDGIRDLTVTGVQTCALPIWPAPKRVSAHMVGQAKDSVEDMATALVVCENGVSISMDVSWRRSEERRVGKEGRSRWSPYHLKKKKRERVR